MNLIEFITKYNSTKYLVYYGLFMLLAVAVSIVGSENSYALDNDFSNGITVDSKLDTSDGNIGDNICDDGMGNCTLRAAIEEANTTVGTQTISFNITGAADFTISGQNGYTIKPTSSFPNIIDTVIIDGYSQSGSQANSSIAPLPFNGRLLIEIDGEDGDFTAFSLLAGSDGSTLKGLVINSVRASAVSFDGTHNSMLQGSYIGVDPTGMIAKSTGSDNTNSSVAITIGTTYTHLDADTVGIIVGGTNPEDRNIVSGNYGGAFGICSVDTIVQGNYVGLAADGVTALGNSFGSGVTTGNFTIDYADGVLIGGDATGATNVISAGSTGGIQPDGVNDTHIIKNLIGTDYTGTQAKGNALAGVSFAFASYNSSVRGNTIAFNGTNGVSVNNSGVNVSILGNSIHDNGELGINLDYLGIIPNDPLDGDTGSNDLLNYPEYTYISEDSGDTIVDYRLDVPAGDYRIEFFSNTTPDPSGLGEGETYLGYQNITHPGGGSVSFSHTLSDTTGVTHLAMTTTQRNMPTSSTFGATSGFGGATLPYSDMSVSQSFINLPESLTSGSVMTHKYAFTNNGPDSIDLSNYTGSTMGFNNMLIAFLPPDITYGGNVNNPNVSCTSAGIGSGVMLGAALANHGNYELVFCNWIGPSYTLGAGLTFDLTFDTIVQSQNNLGFTSYSFLPFVPSSDPDTSIISAIFSSGDDIIDRLLVTTINNFSYAHYPVSVDPHVESSSPPSTQSGLNLLNTGQSIFGIIIFSAVLLISIGFAFTKRLLLKSR